MAQVIYSHSAGKFKIDDNSATFVEDISEQDIIDNSRKQYADPDFKKLNPVQKDLLLLELRKPQYKKKIIDANISIVTELIAESVNEDTHIIQAINSVEDLNRMCNTLAKRMREWYGYYFPELEHEIEDNEQFIKKVLQKTKKEYMQEYGFAKSMGPEIKDDDLNKMLELSQRIQDLYKERDALISYLEKIMKSYCPNVLELTGALIGAKLLEKAGSLRQLSKMPSSTVQVLGAEKALFRHLRNKKARPPKHGFLLSHPYVMNARREDRGNIARSLASKISIAAKIDYFHGEYAADKLKADLEKYLASNTGKHSKRPNKENQNQ